MQRVCCCMQSTFKLLRLCLKQMLLNLSQSVSWIHCLFASCLASHLRTVWASIYLCASCLAMYCHDLVYIVLYNNTAPWSLDSLTFPGNINKILVIVTSASEFMEKKNKYIKWIKEQGQTNVLWPLTFSLFVLCTLKMVTSCEIRTTCGFTSFFTCKQTTTYWVKPVVLNTVWEDVLTVASG